MNSISMDYTKTKRRLKSVKKAIDKGGEMMRSRKPQASAALSQGGQPVVQPNPGDPRMQILQNMSSQQSISPAFGSLKTDHMMLDFEIFLNNERDGGVPLPGLNKQSMHLPQTSFPAYGSMGSNYQPFLTSSTSIQPLTTSHQKMACGEQGSVDQSNKQHNLSSIQSPSHMSSTKQGIVTPGNFMDESFERPSPYLPSSNPASRVRHSVARSGVDRNAHKAPKRKHVVGKKMPLVTPGSSPPSSKKRKVSGDSGDLLEQSNTLFDAVYSVTGLNIMEEEEQLFSESKENSQILEISQCAAQQKEEKLILQKIPLQKKVSEIMAKYGLKNMSNDVERCLSMCVEVRMQTLIGNLIRLSKQRVCMEGTKHRTIVTSDYRQRILSINHKACEQLAKKLTEAERLLKPTKANREENGTIKANAAIRAATGVDDVMSKWQLMAENNQKQGGIDTASSASLPGEDVERRSPQTSTKNTREGQEGERGHPFAAFSTATSVRNAGRHQVVAPGVARSITVKDVIALLERDPQMSKSTLMYRLYNRVCDDAPPGND